MTPKNRPLDVQNPAFCPHCSVTKMPLLTACSHAVAAGDLLGPCLLPRAGEGLRFALGWSYCRLSHADTVSVFR